MNRIAYVAAVMAGYAGYYAARAILRRLDLAAWRTAWNRIPVVSRDTFRDTLLAEEGLPREHASGEKEGITIPEGATDGD